MAMGRKTINSIGVVAAAALLTGAYFGIAGPLLSSKADAEVQLSQARQLNENYIAKIERFQGGQSAEVQQATSVMDLFNNLVDQSLNIESASRAIAAALPPGVKLESFNFGAPQSVSALAEPTMSIGGFAPVAEFGAASSGGNGGGATNAATAAVDPNTPVSGFNRVPFTIKVSASSYDELSDYLNSLSQQPRLLSVVSVDSSAAESVSATIYAFAFSGR